MTWMILVFALQADAGHLATEVKLPPASSSSAPVPRFDDVKYTTDRSVPADVLNRIPTADATRIAAQFRAGMRIHFNHGPVVT